MKYQILPVNVLIPRGPSWSVACYSAAEGKNYEQYCQDCFSSSMMAISPRDYNYTVVPSVIDHKKRAKMAK